LPPAALTSNILHHQVCGRRCNLPAGCNKRNGRS
jgi:hypothetical protein